MSDKIDLDKARETLLQASECCAACCESVRVFLDIAPALLDEIEQLRYAEWDDAPEWAICKAQDEDGDFTYFENEPYPGMYMWFPNDGRYSVVCRGYPPNPNWRETLERRPEHTDG